MNSLVLCIDFDGTITYNDADYPNIGSLRRYAKQIMQILHEHGHKIIISTCRCGTPNLLAKEWCINRGIPFDSWCDNLPERMKEFDGLNPRKISADIYFDDKGFGITKIDARTWISFFGEVIKREDSGVSSDAVISIDFITALDIMKCRKEENV